MYGKTKAGIGLPVLVDSSGRLVEQGAGKYREKTLSGNQFFAFCQTQDMALYTATAAIGLIVYNPPTSGVNLVWGKWAATVWATSATATGLVLAISAQTATPTTVTAATLTGKSLLTGSTGLVAGSAIAYSVATIAVAPVIAWPLFHNTAAINIVGAENMSGDLDGTLASAPGTVTVLGALGAAFVDINVAISWEESPV